MRRDALSTTVTVVPELPALGIANTFSKFGIPSNSEEENVQKIWGL